ncbi:YceI family protein [Dyadobacter fanqingshengii]|uniref:YceI family protein n=1 Tax=Dyadobacter fanqingshengii TaxID=2906443 RepID=A0A9X1P6A9_9BACT|nr:YceI family protein [Dyadobacter fanqingshengii]MCF0039146.1 YceI family protein [Dyadobacter fanqingshengii]USJ34034.1 YceI family protein [Dyadobacter fanqingshengii]
MRNRLQIITFFFAFIGPNMAFGQTSKVVSGSTNFKVKYVLGTCDGTFDAPKGEAVFNENSPQNASFNIDIAANSFKTGNNSRDKDMKSDKYFYVEKHPNINFKSTKVEKKNGKYEATGKLTIRDVTKTVTLPFEAKKNADGSYAVSSTFEVNRLDYKVGTKDWKLKDVVTVDMKAIIK